MIKIWNSNEVPVESISRCLGINKGSIVQAAGSGGKTSIINEIAKENSHLKTAVLTTTKRFAPSENAYIINDEAEIIDSSSLKGQLIEFGTAAPNNKIGWVGDKNFDIIREWAELILIESDGSKRLPLKAAALYEPVFVDEATHTLVVCGLSAIGKNINNVCHRFELIKNKFSEDTIVSETEISWLLNEFYMKRFSMLKPVFIINQADNNELIKTAAEILKVNHFDGLITQITE